MSNITIGQDFCTVLALCVYEEASLPNAASHINKKKKDFSTDFNFCMDDASHLQTARLVYVED